METTEIRELVGRLARPHGEGTVIVEGAAIRAEGSDFDAVEAWILANGGEPEAAAAPPAARGLYGGRFVDTDASRNLGTARYLLPARALDPPPETDAPATIPPPAADDIPPATDPRGD